MAIAKLSEQDYRDLANFRSALRQFLAFSEVAARRAGVTAQQYQALLAIRVSPKRAMPIKDLAEELLLLPNSAVQLVDRLAHAELVERRPSPTDGRSVLVTLTPKGTRLLDQLAVDHHAELIRQKPLLSESLARLRSLTKALTGRG